jgi:uncharacterized protein (TIGR02217 family)
MAIDAVVFPEDIAEGASGGVEYRTTLIRMVNGAEQRNQDWLDGRLKWTVSHAQKDRDALVVLQAFFRARGGRERGFLFKDWSDYSATNQRIGTGDGTRTRWQLQKHYITDTVETRVITRPKNGTVVVRVAGGASAPTISYTTGLVTFSSPPANGAAIEADFEFYVPARFDVDIMSGQMENTGVNAWDSIPIVEIRESQDATAGSLYTPGNLSHHTTRLPVSATSVGGGPQFGVIINQNDAGFEVPLARWSGQRLRFETSFDLLTPPKWAELLAFFRSHKGRAKSFRFKDWSDYRITLEETVSLTSSTFQVVKRYLGALGTIIRNLTKIVPNTIHVYNASDVEVTSGWQVELQTGVITFSAPPGYTPKVTCQFDVPGRFDTDRLSARLTEALSYSVTGLNIVEVDQSSTSGGAGSSTETHTEGSLGPPALPHVGVPFSEVYGGTNQRWISVPSGYVWTAASFHVVATATNPVGAGDIFSVPFTGSTTGPVYVAGPVEYTHPLGATLLAYLNALSAGGGGWFALNYGIQGQQMDVTTLEIVSY